MSDFEGTLNKLLADPAQMEKLMGAAKTLMQPQAENEAGDAAEPIAATLSGLDPKLLGVIARLMGMYNSGSDKDAISPYIKSSSRNQLTRAAELARLARLARLAVNEFGGV